MKSSAKSKSKAKGRKKNVSVAETLEAAVARPLIAPSILSADFAHLADEIKTVEMAGADWLHVDVMDGHFVPNLTIGPLVVEAIRPVTKLPLDCHLMVSNPEDWILPFARAGADIITIHAEAAPHLDRLLHGIRELGVKAGVSINPATPLAAIEEVLDLVDLVLIMSVNPGFGGQTFTPGSLIKIERMREMIERLNPKCNLEVDGGIKPSNIGKVRSAGADMFVVGSGVFNPDASVADSVAMLRESLASVDS